MKNWSFQSTLSLLDNPLWTVVFPIPQKIAEEIQEAQKDRRVVCTIGTFTKHCALMHDGQGGFFIMINKIECKKLKIEPGDQCTLNVELDTSKYGMPVPEAFEAVMDTDPEGQKLFEALTAGKQRTILHMLGKIKNEALQIERTLIFFEHIKRQGGKIEFKVLNAEFKRGK